MADTEHRLSGWQKGRGLLAAALTAWALKTTVDVGWPLFQLWISLTYSSYNGYVPPASQVLALVALYAIFGIPIALIVCLGLGFPAWKLAESRSLRTHLDAMKVGASVGLIASLIGIALGLLMALPTALSDNGGYNYWYGGRQLVAHGLPTPLGWAYKFIDLMITVAVGGVAGLAAKAAAGNPRMHPA